ncbi:hypothetical protein FCL49_21880 [Serratia proteamaculans]|nr:hypothetical protein [Serratia proteamaculans]NTZ30737.1 hypothetical protein [Serratia proteamaculans]
MRCVLGRVSTFGTLAVKARHCSHCFQVLLSQLGCWLFFCLFSAPASLQQIHCPSLQNSI